LGDKAQYEGDKAHYDVMFPKSRKKLPAVRENSFTHQQHLEQQDCMSIVACDKPSDREVQQKVTNREIEIQSTTFKNLHYEGERFGVPATMEWIKWSSN
jgi:hypothetical protein